MKFMLLIHHDDVELAKAGPELWGDYAAFNAALAKAGVGTPGERLNPAKTATRVSVKDGRKKVLDGPYVDTKEQFAGYMILDVPTLEDAVEWAARCPSAKYGTIEVRQISPKGS
ncbi:YciI family protein [Devosia sp.]|uniref:YciI family protein n=1 Tax=Devosia sp. TaxID=1871048 RepID=UPI003262E4D6